ncbi:MAG: PTS sugar transporter subunit IIA [Spirochaetales bacterium]|jgi:mannitol/fructose-specific phosphotransferase system IIA component|nr:PTS sugar transporter subunit IIA [Spirochaetales bacterium]
MAATEMFKLENIILNLPAEDSDAVIRRCGKMLVDNGYAQEKYVEGMLARDHSFSCAIGNFIAIPHGEKEYKENILSPGIVVLTYPEGIDWHGAKVHLVIGIAARGEEHLDILGNVVDNIEEEQDVLNLIEKNDPQAIYNMFRGGPL